MLNVKSFFIVILGIFFLTVISCGDDSSPTKTDSNDTTSQTSSDSLIDSNDTTGQSSSDSLIDSNDTTSSSSSTSSISPQEQITGLAAEVTNEGITVSWNAISNAEGYEIYWAKGTSVSINSSFHSPISNSHSFSQIVLENGADYTFAVRALLVDDGLYTQMSDPVTITFETQEETQEVEATSINFNSTVSGVVLDRNDFKWYIFTAQPGTQYTITIRDETNSTNPSLSATVRTTIYYETPTTAEIRNSTNKEFPISVDQEKDIYVRVSVENDFVAGGFQIRVSDGSE